MKIDHTRHGMLTEDSMDIACYVHERHKIGECPWCDYIRVENISKSFLRRLDECKGIKSLYMWSLGTSLSDTKFNRKVLAKRWYLFVRRMSHVEKWKPVFRVLETGKRGFLHYHVITTTFCEHRIILKIWRDITGEKSNVHVSGYKGNLDPRRLARYLLKYLTKESSKYQWMGEFRGKGRSSRKVSNSTSKPLLIYGGEVYGGYTTLCYERSEPQKTLNTKITME